MFFGIDLQYNLLIRKLSLRFPPIAVMNLPQKPPVNNWCAVLRIKNILTDWLNRQLILSVSLSPGLGWGGYPLGIPSLYLYYD